MNIFFVSLGCDKNLVDSEHMLGSLAGLGYEITDSEEEADVIVVNTCCFIHDAKEESVAALLEMAERKKQGRCRALIAAGCMAERYREEILAEIPEIDAVLGVNSTERIAEVIRDSLQGKRGVTADPPGPIGTGDDRRVVTTGGHLAYLKIAEGCDKACTYCIIPKLRGRFRSVPMERLLKEAESLAEGGVRELILVAQETTLYGKDLYGEQKLHELLSRLCEIRDLAWIRVLYCYPEDVYPELLSVMRKEEKICHYLDIPVQHCSDRVLKRMGRHIDAEGLHKVIRMIRREIPDVALRTTLITGFPGETEEEHRELLDFVKTEKFDRLGVFCYSQEEGTPAAAFPEQIPDAVKESRRNGLMEAQQAVSRERGESMVGRVIEVFTEGYLPGDDVFVGRSRADAPDVDGLVFFTSDHEPLSGDIVRVRVTGATEYDLTGERIP